MAMLELNNVETFYGAIQALFGMSLRCEEGQVTTLIGRNGMGKTTTVGSIIGTLTSRSGEIRFNGNVINGKPAYEVAQLGIGLVPEGRQIFPNLSVRENLIATAANYIGSDDPWTLDKVLEFFRGNPRAIEQLRAPLYEDKVVDFVFQMADVTEQTVTPAELMTEPDEEGEGPANAGGGSAEAAPD